MTTISWTWDIAGAVNQAERKIDAGLRAMTLDAAGLIQNAQRQSPATGRIYGRHRASAPGEAPAPDTGRMVGATFSTPVERIAGGLRSRVVVNTEYAAALELGTEKIAPRPFITSTMNENWGSRLMPIFSAFASRA